ncbi:hypothetical protein Sjap_011267 [Stephania japonica]|uniref:Uncharacterized protein n=1 Tax=Stephania japonica TaxID=461633 RepID=A0AAP0P795_9MAGN
MSVSDLYLAGGVSSDDSSRVVEEFLLGVDVLVEGVVAELERVGSCSSFAKNSAAKGARMLCWTWSSLHFQHVFSSNTTSLLITICPLRGLYNLYALD